SPSTCKQSSKTPTARSTPPSQSGESSANHYGPSAAHKNKPVPKSAHSSQPSTCPPTQWSATPATSAEANGNALPSRARSPSNPRSSSATNQQARSTCRPKPPCSSCSQNCKTTSASPTSS